MSRSMCAGDGEVGFSGTRAGVPKDREYDSMVDDCEDRPGHQDACP